MPTAARRLARRHPRCAAALLLLLPLGWPAAAAADGAAEEEIKREASSIFQSCHTLAAAHAEVLAQASAISNAGRQEGLQNLADEAEQIYLTNFQSGISDTANRITRLEEDLPKPAAGDGNRWCRSKASPACAGWLPSRSARPASPSCGSTSLS